MKIPTEATAILAQMGRRGYGTKHISQFQDTGGGPPYLVSVHWTRDLEGPIFGKPCYSADRGSVLACCRDIERQWSADNGKT